MDIEKISAGYCVKTPIGFFEGTSGEFLKMILKETEQKLLKKNINKLMNDFQKKLLQECQEKTPAGIAEQGCAEIVEGNIAEIQEVSSYLDNQTKISHGIPRDNQLESYQITWRNSR